MEMQKRGYALAEICTSGGNETHNFRDGMKPITSVMERSWSVRGRILAVREILGLQEFFHCRYKLRRDDLQD